MPLRWLVCSFYSYFLYLCSFSILSGLLRLPLGHGHLESLDWIHLAPSLVTPVPTAFPLSMACWSVEPAKAISVVGVGFNE